jgi:hypothetical protein
VPRTENCHGEYIEKRPPSDYHPCAAEGRSRARRVRADRRQTDTANPSFPNPIPPLAAVTAAIDDLQTAEHGALTRIKGAVVLRNEKRTALVGVLHQLAAYIQAVADADTTNAASIIESAGVAVRKTPTRRARAFTAKPGPVSGVVKVVAQVASRRASYEWEYSTDGAPELMAEWVGEIELRVVA